MYSGGGGGRGRGYGGRDRGAPRDRGGNGGDGGSRRRHREDDDEEDSKRQRGDSYGNGGNNAGQSRGNGGGGDRGRGDAQSGHRGARKPKEWLPPEEFKAKLKAEVEKRKQDERDSYDNVKTRPDNIADTAGNGGAPVNLLANFFKIKTRETVWILHNYRVDFDPVEEQTYTKRSLLKVHEKNLKGFIFDGTNLYTPRLIPGHEETLYSEKEAGGGKVKITLKHVGEVQQGDVQYLLVYSLLIKSCFRLLGLDELGRHFYDRTGATNLANLRLEIWPGYSTSVRNFDGGIMLNMDLAHKVLRLDTCLERIRADYDRGRNTYNRDNIQSDLVGQIVITHYNRKTYKIHDIDWDKTPLSTFDQGGTERTFMDYYTERYPEFPIRDTNQPLLISRPSRKDRHRGQRGNILLIPELCNITGLSDAQRGNFGLMREIHSVTSLDPDGRVKKLLNFMNRVRSSDQVQAKLLSWGMKLDPNLVDVPGRVLPAEKMAMSKSGREETFLVEPNADWTNQLKSLEMHSSVEMRKWAIVVGERDSNNVDGWLNDMKFVSRGLNFRFDDNPEIFRVQDTRNPVGYVEAINHAMAQRRDIQMIFCILSSPSVDTYSAIKRRCNIDYGVLSQCFQNKHFRNQKGLKSIATKVVIQLNSKLGGAPWIGLNPFKSSFTMVVGFDVHHSGKGRSAISIGAMVATTNNTFSKFYSTVSSHTNREALSDNMGTDFTKCLHAFKAKNNALPDRIIMYRDGVGQGDLSYVHNVELNQIQKSLTEAYQGTDKAEPKFNFIIVTKKGNARIMRHERNSYDNPTPGTVVDKIITLPERYDFFLVSQQPRRGQTVSPTTYNVLKEEGIGADKIQRLTHKFCHFYYNWSGTVAVPFVCQYAHKLSYLTGIAYRDSNVFANESLAHFLYFL